MSSKEDPKLGLPQEPLRRSAHKIESHSYEEAGTRSITSGNLLSAGSPLSPWITDPQKEETEFGSTLDVDAIKRSPTNILGDDCTRRTTKPPLVTIPENWDSIEVESIKNSENFPPTRNEENSENSDESDDSEDSVSSCSHSDSGSGSECSDTGSSSTCSSDGGSSSTSYCSDQHCPTKQKSKLHRLHRQSQIRSIRRNKPNALKTNLASKTSQFTFETLTRKTSRTSEEELLFGSQSSKCDLVTNSVISDTLTQGATNCGADHSQAGTSSFVKPLPPQRDSPSQSSLQRLKLSEGVIVKSKISFDQMAKPPAYSASRKIFKSERRVDEVSTSAQMYRQNFNNITSSFTQVQASSSSLGSVEFPSEKDDLGDEAHLDDQLNHFGKQGTSAEALQSITGGLQVIEDADLVAILKDVSNEGDQGTFGQNLGDLAESSKAFEASDSVSEAISRMALHGHDQRNKWGSGNLGERQGPSFSPLPTSRPCDRPVSRPCDTNLISGQVRQRHSSGKKPKNRTNIKSRSGPHWIKPNLSSFTQQPLATLYPNLVHSTIPTQTVQTAKVVAQHHLPVAQQDFDLYLNSTTSNVSPDSGIQSEGGLNDLSPLHLGDSIPMSAGSPAVSTIHCSTSSHRQNLSQTPPQTIFSPTTQVAQAFGPAVIQSFHQPHYYRQYVSHSPQSGTSPMYRGGPSHVGPPTLVVATESYSQTSFTSTSNSLGQKSPGFLSSSCQRSPSTSLHSSSSETKNKRGRGRPKGSKNKVRKKMTMDCGSQTIESSLDKDCRKVKHSRNSSSSIDSISDTDSDSSGDSLPPPPPVFMGLSISEPLKPGRGRPRKDPPLLIPEIAPASSPPPPTLEVSIHPTTPPEKIFKSSKEKIISLSPKIQNLAPFPIKTSCKIIMLDSDDSTVFSDNNDDDDDDDDDDESDDTQNEMPTLSSIHAESVPSKRVTSDQSTQGDACRGGLLTTIQTAAPTIPVLTRVLPREKISLEDDFRVKKKHKKSKHSDSLTTENFRPKFDARDEREKMKFRYKDGQSSLEKSKERDTEQQRHLIKQKLKEDEIRKEFVQPKYKEKEPSSEPTKSKHKDQLQTAECAKSKSRMEETDADPVPKSDSALKMKQPTIDSSSETIKPRSKSDNSIKVKHKVKEGIGRSLKQVAESTHDELRESMPKPSPPLKSSEKKSEEIEKPVNVNDNVRIQTSTPTPNTTEAKKPWITFDCRKPQNRKEPTPIFDSKYQTLHPDAFWKHPNSSKEVTPNKEMIQNKEPTSKPIPVATKAALKEDPYLPATSSTVKTMLQVLAVASKKRKPGRKPKREKRPEWGDGKGGLGGLSPGSSCPSNMSPHSVTSGGADSVHSRGLIGMDSRFNFKTKKSKQKKNKKKKKEGGVWRSKHKNVIDPVLLGAVEHLIHDMSNLQVSLKMSKDFWPDRPKSSLPSIFRKQKFLVEVCKVVEKIQGKRGRPKRNSQHGVGPESSSKKTSVSNTQASTSDHLEQRLPLKKRYHHQINKEQLEEFNIKGNSSNPSPSRGSPATHRRSSVQSRSDQGKSTSDRGGGSKRSSIDDDSLSLRLILDSNSPKHSRSSEEMKLKSSKEKSRSKVHIPDVNSESIVSNIAACIDKYTGSSSKREQKQKQNSSPHSQSTVIQPSRKVLEENPKIKLTLEKPIVPYQKQNIDDILFASIRGKSKKSKKKKRNNFNTEKYDFQNTEDKSLETTHVSESPSEHHEEIPRKSKKKKRKSRSPSLLEESPRLTPNLRKDFEDTLRQSSPPPLLPSIESNEPVSRWAESLPPPLLEKESVIQSKFNSNNALPQLEMSPFVNTSENSLSEEQNSVIESLPPSLIFSNKRKKIKPVESGEPQQPELTMESVELSPSDECPVSVKKFKIFSSKSGTSLSKTDKQMTSIDIYEYQEESIKQKSKESFESTSKVCQTPEMNSAEKGTKSKEYSKREAKKLSKHKTGKKGTAANTEILEEPIKGNSEKTDTSKLQRKAILASAKTSEELFDELSKTESKRAVTVVKEMPPILTTSDQLFDQLANSAPKEINSLKVCNTTDPKDSCDLLLEEPIKLKGKIGSAKTSEETEQSLSTKKNKKPSPTTQKGTSKSKNAVDELNDTVELDTTGKEIVKPKLIVPKILKAQPPASEIKTQKCCVLVEKLSEQTLSNNVNIDKEENVMLARKAKSRRKDSQKMIKSSPEKPVEQESLVKTSNEANLPNESSSPNKSNSETSKEEVETPEEPPPKLSRRQAAKIAFKSKVAKKKLLEMESSKASVQTDISTSKDKELAKPAEILESSKAHSSKKKLKLLQEITPENTAKPPDTTFENEDFVLPSKDLIPEKSKKRKRKANKTGFPTLKKKKKPRVEQETISKSSSNKTNLSDQLELQMETANKGTRFYIDDDDDSFDCMSLLPTQESSGPSSEAPSSTETEEPTKKDEIYKRKRRTNAKLGTSGTPSTFQSQYKKTFLAAGLFSEFYKTGTTGHNSDSISKKTLSYNVKDHVHGLLPPPYYCGRQLRQKREDFQLPFDLWWLHAHKQLPGRDVVASWNYKKIKTNVFFDVKPFAHFEAQACQCKPQAGEPGCGEDCINRMTYFECDVRTCPLGEKCTNNQIQKHRGPTSLERFMTQDKGWGVKAKGNLSSGSFVMEYVGEVVSEKEFKLRMLTEYVEDTHHYCLHVDGGVVIDGHRMGGECRFVNHSCLPNCEMQKWTVNGLYRMALFTLRDIEPGEELTYDYNFSLFNPHEGQICRCKAPDCRGVIGGRSQRINTISGKIDSKSDGNQAEGSNHPSRQTSVSSTSGAENRGRDRKKGSTIRRAEGSTAARAIQIFAQVKPMSNQQKSFAKDRRCFLIRNLEKVRRIREKFQRKVAGPPASDDLPIVAPLRPDQMIQTGLTALATARSMQTRRLAIAQDDPTVTKVVKLAQLLREIFAQVTSVSDSHGKPLSRYFNTLPSKKRHTLYYFYIDDPIDLQTIERNINSGLFVNAEQFEMDLLRLFQNNLRYFGFNSPEGQAASKLREMYNIIKGEYYSPLSEIIGLQGAACFYRKEDTKPSSDDDDINCICGQYKDEGMMIQCEKCNIWQHCDCVGQAESEEKYFCHKCGEYQANLDIKLSPQPEYASPGETYHVSLMREELQIKLGDTVYVLRAFKTPDDEKAKDTELNNKTEEPQTSADSVQSSTEDGQHFTHGGIPHKMMSPSKGPAIEASSLTKGNYPTFKTVGPDVSPNDMDIFRIERLWINEKGERFAFGHHYLRPHETFHEPNRKFFHNEVFRVPLYEVLPLDTIWGQCWVMDLPTYAKGRPNDAVEDHVYICEYRVDKTARLFNKVSKPKYPICQKKFAFYTFDQKLRPLRTFVPHEVPDRWKMNLARSRSVSNDKPQARGESSQTQRKLTSKILATVPNSKIVSGIQSKISQPKKLDKLESTLQRLLSQMPAQGRVDASHLLKHDKRTRKKTLNKNFPRSIFTE